MSRRRNRSLGAVSAVAALALIGGVAAQFTTSTTSAPQQIGTGTLALAIDSVAPVVWTDDITNLAAGDSVERFLDLRNAGSLKFSGITLAQTNTLGDLIAAPSDVSITLQGCQVAWNATTGVCPTGAVSVMSSSSVRTWASSVKTLGTFEDFGAGEVRHLKITSTLDKGATNAVQAKTGTITYTFAGAQRAAGVAGTVSDATTILDKPATLSTTPSTATGSTAAFSFTDPTNGAASYSVSWGEIGNSAVAPQQASIPKGQTSYTLTGLKAGTNYDVALTAALGTQKSTSKTTLNTAPSAPTAPSTTSVTATGATVKWTDASAGKATHELTYTAAGSAAQTVTAAAGVTSYTLSGLRTGVAYTVEVRAVLNGAKSSAATTSFTPKDPLATSRVMAGYAMPTGTVAGGGGGTSANGIDSDLSTRWFASGAGANGDGNMTLSFPQAVPLTSIRILNGTSSWGPGISVYDASGNLLGTSSGSPRADVQYSIALKPGSYSYLRIAHPGSGGSQIATIYEVTLNG